MSTNTPAVTLARPRTESFRADLWYGASGTYKTSNFGRLALWRYQLTGKRSRLVHCDTGGFDPIQPLVDDGIIEVWVVKSEENFIEACDYAAQGWWPIEKDGKRFLHKTPPGQMREIACYGFEGLTSMGDGCISHLKLKRAKLSQDPSYIWSDGSVSYAGGNMTYFGFAQDWLHDLVTKSAMLPVDYRIIWTALEGRGEEEGTRVPTFGPAIAGRKSIGKAPQWFGNLLHFEVLTSELGVDPVTKQVKLDSRVRMYTRPHADPVSKIPFPAKTRAPFQFASEIAESYEPDVVELYKKLDEMKVRARAPQLPHLLPKEGA